jgi:(p)ppGpp synthase/HD superfamily hydrolase
MIDETVPQPKTIVDEDFVFDKCLALARKAHAGQFDKQGVPYIHHVTRVGFSLLPNLRAAAVGLLHDIPEDSPLFAHEAYRLIEFDFQMHAALGFLTRPDDSSYTDYIERLCDSRNCLAMAVKAADLHDNLREARVQSLEGIIGPAGAERYRSRYRDALARISFSLADMI